MAIRFYDEALVNKIKKWVKDPNMTILKPDEVTRLFQIKADTGNDRPIKLPFIAISRGKEIEILNANKQVKTFDGYTLDSNKKISIPLNAIPIGVNYQIDIYARGMEEADEYIRNFVFNFVNYPKLKISLPYNDINIEHISNIYLDDNIIDNSDIKEKLFPDQFVRFTLKLELDDAYLFSVPTKDNYVIESVDYQVKKDNVEGETEDEGVAFEDS